MFGLFFFFFVYGRNWVNFMLPICLYWGLVAPKTDLMYFLISCVMSYSPVSFL